VSQPISALPVPRDRRIIAIGYIALTVVVACVAGASFTGLLRFAHRTLHIAGHPALLVPVSLDGAAMLCAVLALRAIVAGVSSAGPRLMLFALVTGSAAANYTSASGSLHSRPAAMYFAGASIVTSILFELVLRQSAYLRLNASGAYEQPLAKFRASRWLRFPARTFRAWSVAVDAGYTRPGDALAALCTSAGTDVLTHVGTHSAVILERTQDRSVDEQVHTCVQLHGLTQAAALRYAWEQLGTTDISAAIDWLAERGVKVTRNNAKAVCRRYLAQQRRSLAPVKSIGGAR